MAPAGPPAAHAAPGGDLAQGEALRRAGRPGEAIPRLTAATEAHPDNADAWLELGLACSAAGRLEAAQQALDRALALAPDYVDAQVARARIAYFRGRLAEARRRAEAVLAAHPDQAEAAALLGLVASAQAAAPARWRLDGAWSYGALSKGLPAASTAEAAITHALADARAFSASVEAARQFDQTDVYGELTYAWRAGYVALAGAADAHFRPQWAVKGGLTAPGWRFGGWRATPSVDLGWSRYPVGDVRSAIPVINLTRGEAEGLTLRWFNVLDEKNRYRPGFGLGGWWRAAARLQLLAGYADAPESDVGRTMRVKTLTLGGAWDVNPALTLRLTAAHEARKVYDRDDLMLGVTRRF